MCLYSHSTQYSSKYISNVKNSFNSEAHALNTISQQLHHMEGACCLHDTGVQKLTLNMLCLFLTSPGEGRPQHNITCAHYIHLQEGVKQGCTPFVRKSSRGMCITNSSEDHSLPLFYSTFVTLNISLLLIFEFIDLSQFSGNNALS